MLQAQGTHVPLYSKTNSTIPFAIVTYNEDNKEAAMNQVNNPTILFGSVDTPYCIIFRDNVGDSIFSGGRSAIFGYTYAVDSHGAQLIMKYDKKLQYRTKSYKIWTDLKNIQMIDQ